MTERFHQVTPIKVDYYCDECETAPLQVSGPALPNGKTPHYCPNCQALKALDLAYPLIRFDDILGEAALKGDGKDFETRPAS